MARPSPQTDRVVALIELLSARPDVTITLAEATRRLRINKSTCHAMLTSLTEQAWLLRDPVRKTYRLGPALIGVARVAARSFPALELAHPVMVDLSLEIGVNCAAIGIGVDHTEVLEQIREVRALGEGLRVGATIPLRPPFSAAAVAWAGPAVRERWLGYAPAEMRDRYRGALDAIQAQGYALEAVPSPAARYGEISGLISDHLSEVDREKAIFRPDLLEEVARDLVTHDDYLVPIIDPATEYSVITISAPVFDADGAVTLLLSAWGFTMRVPGGEVDRVGRLLVTATSKLSLSLRSSGTRRGMATD
jgi:DNA-binding IclR family transcriptional regulator